MLSWPCTSSGVVMSVTEVPAHVDLLPGTVLYCVELGVAAGVEGQGGLCAALEPYGKPQELIHPCGAQVRLHW